MLKQAILKITDGQNLTANETSELIEFMSTGEAIPSQISALLVSLKMKGETSEEIAGFAKKMREKALSIDTSEFNTIVDSCGTGGDKANTFNISTAAAILASASGLHIAKHSNYGFTSKCGSSNVIQELGLQLSNTPEGVKNSLKANNIAFLHAPYFHKCTSYVNSVRKELGIRTVFNLLGPLTNPTRPTGQVIGVPSPELCKKITFALKELGCKKALVVNGIDPIMDEISTCGKTFVSRLENGNIDSFEIHPEDFGLKQAKINEVAGDTPETNAEIITNIFSEQIKGPKLDILLLNTAALLWAGNKASTIEEGLKTARNLVESGQALKKLISLKTS